MRPPLEEGTMSRAGVNATFTNPTRLTLVVMNSCPCAH
ncbi:MAG: hypothetical protein HY320_03725 [Armatimonadetes bacterium]|nr:hypothetical protein [Armatimonadota bacterium]